MITFRIFPSRTMRRLGLLVIVLLASGCGKNSDELLARAKQAREIGNHSAAIIDLKNAIEKSPDSAEARFLLGSAYNDTGNHASAERQLRRALELGYDPARVVVPLGRSLLALEKFQSVLAEVRVEGTADDRTQAGILTLRGLAALGLERVGEARESFDQALAKQPELSDALLGQARLAARAHRLDEAERLIERAIASTPGSIDAWLMKGDLLRNLNRNGAVAAYQKVLGLSPENVPARLNLVSMQIAANDFDDAAKQLDQARKLAPKSPMIRYMEGLLEFRKANYSVARDAVLQVLKVAPDHLPSILLAGAIQYALGSHAHAQTYLARVVEQAPGNLQARKLLVASLTKSGNTQRAVGVLEPGLKQAPDDPGLLALAGELAIQDNDFVRAITYFEKAAELDPASAGVRTRLAASRLASGQADLGLADLEAAVQLDSDKYQADVLLVTSYLQRGEFDLALKAMRSLEKKQPNNPLTFNLKAAAYQGKNDTAGARKALQRALELQPTYLPAALNLAQLDLQDKKPHAARRQLETILEKDPNHVQALLALANLGPRIGATLKEQVGWLERAQKASPRMVLPTLMLARHYFRIGDQKQALEFVQKALTIDPNNIEVLETLGAIQVAGGEKNQAQATYGKLVTLQPKSAVALFRLAGSQALNTDFTSAASTLRRALALQPVFIDAQEALAQLELRAGRSAEAMKIARQVQEQAAKSPVGFTLEGDVLMADRKFLPAAKLYERAYGMAKSGMLAMKLHEAYSQAGKSDEAQEWLAQWLKVSPEDVAARLYSAAASLKTGRYENAIEQYEWLRQKNPDNIVVLNNLSWAYHQVKDARALPTAERAYKLKPDNPAVADTLGTILVEQGHTQRGLELLQKAIADAPHALTIRYHFAQAWLKAGEKARAREELVGLLSVERKFPEQNEARNLLRELSK